MGYLSFREGSLDSYCEIHPHARGKTSVPFILAEHHILGEGNILRAEVPKRRILSE